MAWARNSRNIPSKRFPSPPTPGICRTDSRGGIRPSRKPSLSSKKQYNTSLSTSPSTSSQLSVRSAGNPASGGGGGGAQSCPTSPRCSKALSQRQGSGGAATRHPDNPRAAGEYAAEIDLGEISELRRSSSIVSTFRPRSSPAGLYSYTGVYISAFVSVGPH